MSTLKILVRKNFIAVNIKIFQSIFENSIFETAYSLVVSKRYYYSGHSRKWPNEEKSPGIGHYAGL